MRPRAHTNSRVKVPVGGSCPFVAESNCVAERRGGEQLEANNQSVNTTMLNSIRFQTAASLLDKGEAREPQADPRRARQLRQTTAPTASTRKETFGMVGDGTVGSWSDVKWGTRSGQGSGVHAPSGAEEARPEGVRVLVVAKKSRNGDGAKGDRKVEA